MAICFPHVKVHAFQILCQQGIATNADLKTIGSRYNYFHDTRLTKYAIPYLNLAITFKCLFLKLRVASTLTKWLQEFGRNPISRIKEESHI